MERRNNESSREEGVDHIDPGDGSDIPENTAEGVGLNTTGRKVRGGWRVAAGE